MQKSTKIQVPTSIGSYTIYIEHILCQQVMYFGGQSLQSVQALWIPGYGLKIDLSYYSSFMGIVQSILNKWSSAIGAHLCIINTFQPVVSLRLWDS